MDRRCRVRPFINGHGTTKGGIGKYVDFFGYVQVRTGRTAARYEREHRLVVERAIGRRLTRKEDVHHINGDKADNRIENLQVMSKNKHTTYHLLEDWRSDPGLRPLPPYRGHLTNRP